MPKIVCHWATNDWIGIVDNQSQRVGLVIALAVPGIIASNVVAVLSSKRRQAPDAGDRNSGNYKK